MARVCALVLNSVSRDSRVLKQADSLVRAGHDVTIVGIADRNFADETETLANGVRIVRTTPTELSPTLRFARFVNRTNRLRIRAIAIAAITGVSAFVLLTGSTNQKVDFVLALLVAGGVLWTVANAARVGDAITAIARFTLRSALGRARAARLKRWLVELCSMAAPALFDWENRRRLRRRLDAMIDVARKLKPDVAHCHDVHTLPAGVRLKSRHGCRLVYDAHEIYEHVAQGDAHSARRYCAIHRAHAQDVDAFVTINESIAGWYAANYPALARATIVMNASPRAPGFVYDGRLHAAADLPAGARILLYQGGFATKRGLDCLVEAAGHLPEDWTLVMMGWGRSEDDLRLRGEEINGQAAEAGLPPRVKFVPPAPQADLPLWTAGATVGVIPYENVGLNHWYCTPNKLWEYPAAGVPMLVSPFPELSKPVKAYGCGWMLPEPPDPRTLAATVAALSDEDMAKAREGCRKFIASDNWTRYAERLVDLYARLVPAPASKASRTSCPNGSPPALAPGDKSLPLAKKSLAQ